MNKTDELQHMLAITMQITIARLGPLPDELGEPVKDALASDKQLQLIMLGLAFEKCVKSYKPLKDWAKQWASLKTKNA